MPKIIADIFGGLGNQLFIYAAARSLADRTNGELILDPSLLTIDKVYKRPFLLDQFSIRSEKVLPLKYGIGTEIIRLRNHLFRYARFQSKRWIYEQEATKFQPSLLEWSGTKVTLDGYWQSERYFDDNLSNIYQDLVPHNKDLFELTKIAKQILDTPNSVFLHIRSYREVPGNKDGNFTLPITYFENSMKEILDMFPKPHFFLFSDDHDWVRSKLDLPINIGLTIVENNDLNIDSPIFDFYLMTLCQHGIISNSSYSWWSGWICEQRNNIENNSSIIICPTTSDNQIFYPERWRRVEL